MKLEIWVNGIWSATYENVGMITDQRVNENGEPDRRGDIMRLELKVSE